MSCHSNEDGGLFDVSTQDILGTLRSAEDADNLYFLYIATPGGAPSKLHTSVIKPFLVNRGWRKVSSKKTGFRALYFLDTSEVKEYLPKPKRQRLKEESPMKSFNSSISSPSKRSALERAKRDRTKLKEKVERYRKKIKGQFTAHITLSRPVDYEEDFLEFASQPNSIEQ